MDKFNGITHHKLKQLSDNFDIVKRDLELIYERIRQLEAELFEHERREKSRRLPPF